MTNLVYDFAERDDGFTTSVVISAPRWVPVRFLQRILRVTILTGRYGPETSRADFGASDFGYLPPRRSRYGPA